MKYSRILFLIIVAGHLMDLKIIFERYEIETNPNIIRSNISFSDDHTTFSVHATVLKAYDVKIFVPTLKKCLENAFTDSIPMLQIKVKVQQKLDSTSNKSRIILTTPKINYCDLTKGWQNFPVVTIFFTELGKSTNNSMSCPVCPKDYYVNEFGVNETTFPLLSALKSGSNYVTTIAVTDENGRSPYIIFKFTFHFRFVKL